MANENNLKRNEENARLITKLSVISGIGALIMLAVTMYVGTTRGGDTIKLAVIPFAFALLFSAAAFIYGLLASNAAREEEEKELLSKRMESRALNVEEDVRFTAGRSFSNYCRFAPFVLAAISLLMMAAMLWRINAGWSERKAGAIAEISGSTLHTSLLAAVMMMVCVFAGAFYIGQSRQSGFRWLRSIGAWLVAGFLSLLLVAAGTICYGNNLTMVDGICAKVLFWVFAVLGGEFAVNFAVEFYRPRTLAEAKPVFESQLLALFTEPGGVMKNIASGLDYQFGFKVSGTWLYGFVERAFFPMLIIWALIFWCFTCLHEIGANQVGVRETFGRRHEGLLESGIYWTLPYPFGTIRKFSYDELKLVHVGESDQRAKERSLTAVVLWTNQHGGADAPFIVAVSDDKKAAADEAKQVAKEEPGANNKSEQKKANTSISLVNLAVPIEYRIRKDGVINYGYNHANPEKILKMIGQQAVSEYLAGATMDKLMSFGRTDAEKQLVDKIQTLADKNQLGVTIVRVGIMDAHPPVEKVAPAYQEVVGAKQKSQTEILRAKAVQEQITPQAEVNATEIVATATREKDRKIQVAEAEKERFLKQLKAYSAFPRLFKLSSQLDVLESASAAIRKFVVSKDLNTEVYQLNFEKGDRLDLGDLDALSNSEQK